MFNMNKLWEAWVLRQLRRQLSDAYEIDGQVSKHFWKPEESFGYSKSLKPDIILRNRESDFITFLDTIWKLPKDNRPADDDLKQMFSYNKLFNSKNAILIYPGNENGYSGQFFNEEHGGCRVVFLNVLDEKGNLKHSSIMSLSDYVS
jgi:5-methylcytosine-specific restriction enzyme subunit McrC